MKVCLRHESQSDGTHFCDVEPEEFLTLVANIDSIGVYYEGDVLGVIGRQYVLGPVEAYAEIIIGTGE